MLTDGPFFGGSLDDLRSVAARVDVPVLRKDFILAEEQVLEARAAGASAVLLIVRALTPSRLAALRQFAADLELAALVEAHTAAEIATALDAGAEIVGINSRDLDTFRIDIDGAWRLLRRGAVARDRGGRERHGEASPTCRGRPRRAPMRC